MEKYELAELDYKNGMKYKDIADKYEVSLNTVKSWKTRYKWCKDDKKVCTQKTKKVCTQKKGAVSQNKSEELYENIDTKHISEVIDEYELDEVIGGNLTDKQKLFCWYYAKTFNVRSSALKAGYSIHYATSKIYDLIQHEKIKLYLDEIRKKMFSKVEASVELLYERHCSIAFADTADFLNPDGSLRNLNEVDGSLVKKVTSNVKKETVERFGVDGETTSLKTIDEVKTSIELEDRSKSLDFLTKFHGLDPSFKNQKEKLNLEKDKISVLEERNKILENANKPPSSKVEDMSEDSKINLLKKYGGA